MKAKLFTLLGLGTICIGLSSQIQIPTTPEDKPCKFTLGAFTGIAFGVTDMSRSKPGLAFGLATEKRFESGLMIHGKFNSSYFSGSSSEVYYRGENDPWTKPPQTKSNYHAETDLQDMSINFGYNVSRLYTTRPKLSAVVSGGMGFAHFKSKVTYTTGAELPTTSEITRNILIMPLTLDLHYRISSKWKLGIAAQYNFTPTDDMDQVAPLIDYSRDNYGSVGIVLKYKVL